MPADHRFTLPSFAKINLHLEVLGKRSDGYHELCTVFQSVSLCDRISFGRESRTLKFTCSDEAIPNGEDNLVLRAANLLRSAYSITEGAEIHLEKHIPSPGGLGGGSSNAAVALVGLSRLWGIAYDKDRLVEMAAELGADVPYFLCGGTAAGTGRGDSIRPLEDAECGHILIITPNIEVSTRDAFALLAAGSLTKTDENRILLNCRFESGSFDKDTCEMRNDLEAAVFSAHPEIEEIRSTLVGLGAQYAVMSGSGASVFGSFEKKETRQAALKALDSNINWRKFAVAAVSRREYREALGSV